MSVNCNSLFTALGKIGHIPYVLAGDQSAIKTLEDALITSLAAIPVTPEYASLVQGEAASITAINSGISIVSAMAAPTLLYYVKADNPTITSVPGALQYLYQSMLSSGDTVKTCTVGATVAAWPTVTNTGTGLVSVSTIRGDGRTCQNCVAEVMYIRCTQDSYTGGATAGQEQFSILGQRQTAGNVWDYNFPTGSNMSGSSIAISAAQNQSSTGNVLNNGAFSTWTSALAAPTGWTSNATWGTGILRTATTYAGSYAVEFVAGLGLNQTLDQVFNDSTGSTVELSALTPYHVNFYLKNVGGAPGAGVLTIEVVDGSGTVINDQKGTANSTTINMNTVTSSFVAHQFVFRLPEVLPSAVHLRFRMSTALTTHDVILSYIACAPARTTQGNLGPNAVIFSGATPFALNDAFSLTTTNDRGGVSYLATFQALMDRLFGMTTNYNIILPSSATPTQADTKITT